jgi:cold shock protein
MAVSSARRKVSQPPPTTQRTVSTSTAKASATAAIAQEPPAERFRGTVQWFNREKGMGFITDARGESYFVLYNDIQMKGFRTLEQGQAVLFTPNESSRGLTATNVVPC